MELDFVEMESSLKKRILYLEHYKLAARSRLALIQGKLDASVSQDDYLATQSELESLREDHLVTLRREVEARMTSLKSLDRSREVKAIKLVVTHLKSEIEGSRGAVLSLQSELEHQKQATQKALKAVKSSAELSSIISEMAKYRGEASRLEVLMIESNKRSELLADRVKEISEENDKLSEQLLEMQKREELAVTKESQSRKMALDMQLKYGGGLTTEEASQLNKKLEHLQKELEETKRDALRHKELADIATVQAQTLSNFKQQHLEELRELKEYCSRLESRSEDELLIGRLQRLLMSTRASYKAFIRKYQFTRENIRKRELGMRILETRLDEREKTVISIQDSHRLEINSLKKALRNMKNTVFVGGELSSTASKSHQSGKKNNYRKKSIASVTGAFVPIGQNLVDMSEKVNDLAEMAEDAVVRASEVEDKCRTLEGSVEDLEEVKLQLEQQAKDLEAVLNEKTKQKNIAARLIALSEELRTSRLSNLQQRRQIQMLRQEKKHLQTLFSNIEADVVELEEDKTRAETKSLIFDIEDESEMAKLSRDFNEERNFLKLLSSDAEHFIDEKDKVRGGNKSTNNKKDKLSIQVDGIDEQEDSLFETMKENITPEVLLDRVKSINTELNQSRRELSSQKLQSNNLMNQMANLQELLREKDGNISYYEKVLQEEGIAALILNQDGVGNNRNRFDQPGNGRQYKMLKEDQEKIQEAASATIGSLRALH